SFGTLINSTFTIEYTTVTAFAQGSSWSPTSALPSNVFRTHIATTSVNPGITQAIRLTGLISGGTYYFRSWTKDDVGNYAAISNGATTYATPVVLSLLMSTNTIDLASPIDMGSVLVIS